MLCWQARTLLLEPPGDQFLGFGISWVARIPRDVRDEPGLYWCQRDGKTRQRLVELRNVLSAGLLHLAGCQALSGRNPFGHLAQKPRAAELLATEYCKHDGAGKTALVEK